MATQRVVIHRLEFATCGKVAVAAIIAGMPKSKSRSSKRRARRRTAHARSAQDRHEQVFETSLADFERMLTAQDRQLLAEAMDAEQHGELGDALACLQSTLRPTGNSWESGLTEMVELGDAAQAWHWTRFTVAAAGRWIARLPVPLVARVQREIAEAAEGAEGPLILVYPGWVAGLSAVQPAVTGYLLFDELMLEVFLVQIAPWLAEQAGGGRTWAEVQGRVYELLDVDGGELSVRDYASGEQKTIRHSGEAWDSASGALCTATSSRSRRNRSWSLPLLRSSSTSSPRRS